VGRATALALARDGADVIVNTHRSVDALEAVADDIRAMGRRALAITADAGDSAEVAAMFHRARAELGAPDILVISAGGRWRPRSIDAIPPEEWRGVMAEEIDSYYLAVREALPAMRAQAWGRIVVVGGYGADQWDVPDDRGPVDYALGKAARHWLTRTLARLEARHGITVNAVAPGPITRVPLEDVRGAVLGTVPLDAYRRPTQVDVAETLVWLCRSPAVNGAVIDLPGPRPGAVTLEG
jgi:3-oxoacyl-[acyl-carrier protein] reductase